MVTKTWRVGQWELQHIVCQRRQSKRVVRCRCAFTHVMSELLNNIFLGELMAEHLHLLLDTNEPWRIWRKELVTDRPAFEAFLCEWAERNRERVEERYNDPR